MITIGPIRRAGKVVIYNPDNPSQVRQFTGTGAPQWVDLATATFSECSKDLVQIGTTGSYSVDIDVPAGREYAVHIYQGTATAFTDTVIIVAHQTTELQTAVDELQDDVDEVLEDLADVLATIEPLNDLFEIDETSGNYKFTKEALENSPAGNSASIVGPVIVDIENVVTAVTSGGAERNYSLFQHTSQTLDFQVRNADKSRYDLTGHQFRFLAIHTGGKVAWTIENDDIALISSEGDEILDVVRVTISTTETAETLNGLYRLRDLTLETVLAYGTLYIKTAPLTGE